MHIVVEVYLDRFDDAGQLAAHIHLVDRLQRARGGDRHREIAPLHLGGFIAHRRLLAGQQPEEGASREQHQYEYGKCPATAALSGRVAIRIQNFMNIAAP